MCVDGGGGGGEEKGAAIFFVNRIIRISQEEKLLRN